MIRAHFTPEGGRSTPCFWVPGGPAWQSDTGQRQGLAAAPQPLVEEEDDGVDGRFDQCHHAAGEQLAAQQVGDAEGHREVDQGEAAGLGLQAVVGLELVPAKVVEVEGDRVHGGLDEGDQAGGEQFAGQQVSHGEGDTKVQDGEADGLFHGGVSSGDEGSITRNYIK